MARVKVGPALPVTKTLDVEIADWYGLNLVTGTKIIQKGLAFRRERSGTDANPGR